MSLYFDHHATTPVDLRVREAMWPWFGEKFGNAASISHAFGHEAAAAVEDSRRTLTECLNCEPEELIFTSGATESNNLALKGLLSGSPSHLIVTAAEHRAVLDPARRLQRMGCQVTVLPVDRCGTVDPARVAAALTPQTRLVSVMLANNEVGTLNPVAEIADICGRREVAVHCDAAQAFGRIPLDLSRLPVDLLSLTAHKLYGPKGIGALFVRRGDSRPSLTPLIDGGGHERGLRSGTLPVPLVVGFAAAALLAHADLPEESRRLRTLRDDLQQRLLAGIPGLVVNGPAEPARRLPQNLSVTLPRVDGDALLARLSQTGLAVSSGAACSSANPGPSHVLRAMGLNDAQARATIRFGLGRDNSPADVAAAADIVCRVHVDLMRLAGA
jgi:cysteine desulfurase